MLMVYEFVTPLDMLILEESYWEGFVEHLLCAIVLDTALERAVKRPKIILLEENNNTRTTQPAVLCLLY